MGDVTAFEIAAGIFALVVTFGLTFFGVLFLHKTEVTCPRPLPGPELPWKRCPCPCPWCDHMQAWDASEERSGPAMGPYRAADPPSDLTEGPEEIQAAPYFVAEDLRCLRGVRGVLSIKYAVLKLFRENRPDLLAEPPTTKAQIIDFHLQIGSSGIVDHGDRSKGDG